MSQKVEELISKKVVDCLLKAGYTVGVNDGEETTVENSTNKREIHAAMFTTDEDWVLAYKNGEWVGWIHLAHNNNTDVICDYTVNLEDVLKAATDLAESYE